MYPPPSSRGSWFTLLCVLLLGVFLVRGGTGGPPQPATTAAASTVSGVRHGPAALPPAPAPLPRSAPLRVTVSAADIDAPLVPVGIATDGGLDTPPLEHADVAGWYSDGAAPGERGTAVVVGHVDNDDGPAVFHPLGSLRPGARVEVVREDGRTAVFALYAIEVLPLRDFPAEKVYADGADAEIRLITCGGVYSRSGGYEGNVVAFGRLVAVR